MSAARSGGVGNGNVATLSMPITLSCSTTLSTGDMRISGALNLEKWSLNTAELYRR